MHPLCIHQDGRLLVNDQLVAVNGESLLGRANAEAMEALRRAMQATPTGGRHIHLVVTRRRRQSSSNLVGGGGRVTTYCLFAFNLLCIFCTLNCL